MRDQPAAAAGNPATVPAFGGWPLIGILPGVLLTGAIGAVAFAVSRFQDVFVISPIILAIVFGMIFRRLSTSSPVFRPGVLFAQRRILRAAIILLGLQLTITQVLEVGLSGLLVIGVAVVTCFLFTQWFGRLIGVDAKLTELIAAGTSICGASAVVATNTVTRASDEDVAYAVACVTIFGSVSMILEPLLPQVVALSQVQYGVWAGASIHEIAQVVAAAFVHGEEAGHVATVVKLSRVVLLGPMVIALGFFAQHMARNGDVKWEPAPMPWFILGFVVLLGINSMIRIPPEVMAWIAPVTTIMFAMALAGMGLETDVIKLRLAGVKPLALGAASAVFIACVSLAAIKLTAG